MRIGIVGSGIAGLTAAWMLRRAGHEVTLFEKLGRLGLGAHGVDFEPWPTRFRELDVPSRMFNASTWPSLVKLYDQIGVLTTPVEPSKSYSDGKRKTYLKFKDGFRPALSTSLLLPKSRAILSDMQRMLAAAKYGFEPVQDESFGEYLDRKNYRREFTHEFLLPSLASTVCTCSYQAILDYPAVLLLEAMQNLVGADALHRTAHGTGDVVERLVVGLEDIRLNTEVMSIRAIGDVCRMDVVGGEALEFEHVIVATQANAAVRLLGEATVAEKEMLGSFEYQNVETVVHTDDHLMPANRKNWSTFNMLSDKNQQRGMCSVWMNSYYGADDAPDVFQTITPFESPDESKLIQRILLQRPVVNQRSMSGLGLLRQIHEEPDRRIWFCGSYAGDGVPLLESGVSSAASVVECLGVEVAASQA